MTPEQRRARGIAARSLANDATLNEAWDEIENELREKWEKCIFPRVRDRYWTELKHIRAMRQKLATYASHAPRD